VCNGFGIGLVVAPRMGMDFLAGWHVSLIRLLLQKLPNSSGFNRCHAKGNSYRWRQIQLVAMNSQLHRYRMIFHQHTNANFLRRDS
jgi:hypothetical protein